MKKLMQDMNMRKKLLIGFMLVVVLAVLVGGSGVAGLLNLNNDVQLINIVSENAMSVQRLQLNLESQRSYSRDAALRLSVGYLDGMLEEIQLIDTLDTQARQMMDEHATSFTQPRSMELHALIVQSYEQYAGSRDALLGRLRDHDMSTLIEDMLQAEEDAEQVIAYMEELTAFASGYTDDMTDEASAQAVLATSFMVVIVLVSIGISLVLALYISGQISGSTMKLVKAADKLSAGDVDVKIAVDGKDEMGQLAQAFRNMAKEIRLQAQALIQVAEGDYTKELAVRSSRDIMNISINEMISRNNEMIMTIRDSVKQIDIGSEQIAQASQEVATGSTQQAATLEQFTAAITEISQQAVENSRTASEALDDNQRSNALMQESIEAMNRMVEAMETISIGSQDIYRIIKVIEDIAFQTNILSLNAAVEAARAGQFGSGFAVVADEVRTLASRSREAAKDTADLIRASTRHVDLGNEIVKQVDGHLRNIAEYSEKNSAKILEIDEASRRQSFSLSEVTSGIGQITSVVQANSATAEETAASSQEMAAQSALLTNILSGFKVRDSHQPYPTQAAELPAIYSMPAKEQEREEEESGAGPEHAVLAFAGAPARFETGMRLVKGTDKY